MRKIFEQRFTCATIELYKNYCINNLDTKNKLITKNQEKEINTFGDFFYTIKETNKNKTDHRSYFKISGDLPYLEHKGKFITTKQNQIRRHFGNPFSSIEVITIIRKIIEYDDKITIRLYRKNQTRGFNRKFFKTTQWSRSLTINKKNGELLNCFTQSGSKNQFRKNYFYEVESNLRIILGYGEIFQNTQFHGTKNVNTVIEVLKNKINDERIQLKIGEFFNRDLTCFRSTANDVIFRCIMDFFVKKRNIKTPNNFYHLLVNFYPTEKFLKKNDRKLVASVLDMFAVKSKSNIKLIHENPNIDLPTFITLCKLFGDNYQFYLSQINRNFYSKNIKKGMVSDRGIPIISVEDNRIKSFLISYILPQFEELSKKLNETDKKSIIKIINTFATHDQSGVMSLIKDHINMLSGIREYIPETKIESFDKKSFDDEHTEFARLLQKIRRGTTTKLIFNQTMLNDLEEPITILKTCEENPLFLKVDMVLKPYVLKTEEEYIEEGDTMHHCVSSYVDKTHSIIVSIRTEDTKDRVTCEFDTLTGQLIQARHFCNGQPPEHYETAINTIKSKSKYYANKGILKSINKIRVPIQINGVEIVPRENKSIDLENLF